MEFAGVRLKRRVWVSGSCVCIDPDEPGCRQADTLAGGDVFRADSSLGLVDSGAGGSALLREIYLMLTVDGGTPGDVMGDTEVIEGVGRKRLDAGGKRFDDTSRPNEYFI